MPVGKGIKGGMFLATDLENARHDIILIIVIALFIILATMLAGPARISLTPIVVPG